MDCKECGIEYIEGTKFCTSCGKTLIPINQPNYPPVALQEVEVIRYPILYSVHKYSPLVGFMIFIILLFNALSNENDLIFKLFTIYLEFFGILIVIVALRILISKNISETIDIPAIEVKQLRIHRDTVYIKYTKMVMGGIAILDIYLFFYFITLDAAFFLGPLIAFGMQVYFIIIMGLIYGVIIIQRKIERPRTHDQNMERGIINLFQNVSPPNLRKKFARGIIIAGLLLVIISPFLSIGRDNEVSYTKVSIDYSGFVPYSIDRIENNEMVIYGADNIANEIGEVRIDLETMKLVSKSTLFNYEDHYISFPDALIHQGDDIYFAEVMDDNNTQILKVFNFDTSNQILSELGSISIDQNEDVGWLRLYKIENGLILIRTVAGFDGDAFTGNKDVIYYISLLGSPISSITYEKTSILGVSQLDSKLYMIYSSEETKLYFGLLTFNVNFLFDEQYTVKSLLDKGNTEFEEWQTYFDKSGQGNGITMLKVGNSLFYATSLNFYDIVEDKAADIEATDEVRKQFPEFGLNGFGGVVEYGNELYLSSFDGIKVFEKNTLRPLGTMDSMTTGYRYGGGKNIALIKDRIFTYTSSNGVSPKYIELYEWSTDYRTQGIKDRVMTIMSFVALIGAIAGIIYSGIQLREIYALRRTINR